MADDFLDDPSFDDYLNDFTDFLPEDDLLQLVNLSLPVPQLLSFSSPSFSLRDAPFRTTLGPIEPPANAYSSLGRRQPLGTPFRPPLDTSRITGASSVARRTRPVGTNASPAPGPTLPGASNPPTPAAPRRPAPSSSSINPSSATNRSLPIPNQILNSNHSNPPPLPNPNRSATTGTTNTSSSAFSSNRPPNGLPSARSDRGELDSDDFLFLNELSSRDFSSPPPLAGQSSRQHLNVRIAQNNTTSSGQASRPSIRLPITERNSQSNTTSSGQASSRFSTSGTGATATGSRSTPGSALRREAENSSEMASQTRSKPGPRIGDLTLPSAPSGSAAGSSTTPASSLGQQRSSRGSTSQLSQQQPSQGFSSSSSKRKREAETDVVKDEVNDDDLFGDDLFAGHEVVDLVDREEMPPEVREEKKPKNYVKLSAFNCVICMDDVTDLTVTHCGHLFCSACLHSALHIDVTKRVCPICRQKIDNRPSNGKWSSRAKGYYPLELKLMTKTTLGKRAASS
ncbi:hypothetical protein N656DRAFT_827212 [Canariomyces notabilis]|uniref:RING-type domain-containing protein n=1 Tax=Canariomyces notabilis TaxID=2074819 RepID=A0AAN6YVJ5_9PEZI|nr:hypothetical protein N656DRAFT_827212 [Canariomyces arenarius]